MSNETSTNKWIRALKKNIDTNARFYTSKMHEIIDEENRKKAEYDKKNMEDTNLRIEIHKRIEKQVKEGKTILEIVQNLNSENRYQKYGIYFPTWITDQFDKKQKEHNKMKKEDMEK